MARFASLTTGQWSRWGYAPLILMVEVLVLRDLP
jgi:hypothetical protein